MSPTDWAGLGFEERQTIALESIAKSLEKLANPPVMEMDNQINWATMPNPDDLQNIARQHERHNKA